MSGFVSVSRHDREFPRAVLIADGAAAAGSGLVLVAGARPITSFFGAERPILVALVGGLVALYGLWLLWRAIRHPVDRRLISTIMLANVAWVLASVIVLLANTPLSEAGRWAVGLAAAVVALFAAIELLASRQLQ